VLGDSIVAWFADERNRTLVRKLTENGVDVVETGGGDASSDVLAGKSFVLTGKLETMTRPEAEERLRRAGATVTSSVSKKTTYLVAGEDAGSKAARAQELGTTIITEAELVRMLSGAGEATEEDVEALEA
jgi:DNA ligase (NAD+)